MRYEVEIVPKVLKQVASIHAADRKTVYQRMKALGDDPRPAGTLKLAGLDSWRIRIGNYRVIYDIDDTARVVTIWRVGPRNEGTYT